MILTTGAAAEEKKDEAAGVVKVIEYDLNNRCGCRRKER